MSETPFGHPEPSEHPEQPLEPRDDDQGFGPRGPADRSFLDHWSPARWLFFALALLMLYQMAIVALWNGRGGLWLLGLAAAPAVGLILPIYALMRRFGLSFRHEMTLTTMSPLQTLGVVLSVAGMLPLAYALSILNARYASPVPEYWQFFEALRPTDAMGFSVGLLAIVVMIPLGEELLFRRIVQGVLSQHLSPWVAVLLSGVLFGAAHMTPWVLLPISGLGVLLGILTNQSRTITAAWLGHALFNLFSFLELTITGDPDSQSFESVAVQPLPLLVGAALVLLGIRLSRAPRTGMSQPQ